jgi:hypothetical protein
MSNQDQKNIQVDLESANTQVSLSESIQRLMKNRDFKKVMTEGYFKDNAVRLVTLKGNPEFQSAEDQAHLIKEMDSIGSVQNYLQAQLTMGHQAAGAIEDYEEELERLREQE